MQALALADETQNVFQRAIEARSPSAPTSCTGSS